MPFTQEIAKALQSGIGPTAIPDAAYQDALKRAEAAVMKLRAQAKDGSLPLLALPAETGDLAAIEATASAILEGASDIVVLGTGGPRSADRPWRS